MDEYYVTLKKLVLQRTTAGTCLGQLGVLPLSWND